MRASTYRTFAAVLSVHMATGSVEKAYVEDIKAKLEEKLLPRDENGYRKWQFGPRT